MLLRSPLLDRRADLGHGFTTRQDTAGRPLDLGPGASPGVWAGVAEAAGLPGAPVALVSQVHGRVVWEVEVPGLAGEGDALITERPDLLLAVRIADCVPVLLAGPGVVAAVHAGWRGVAAGVIAATLDRLGARGPFVAVIGPSIGVERYEVGEEVIAGIVSAGVPEAICCRRDLGPRPHAAVAAAAAWQLRQGGVNVVDQLPYCTAADPSRFFSFRRDGAGQGRLAAVIGRRATR